VDSKEHSSATEGDLGGSERRTAVPEEKREEVLETIWGLQAAAIMEALRNGDPSAALLNVTTKWLADQGVNWDALKARRGSPLAPALASALPFAGDDADGIEGEQS
jgi:hypothetical protein